MASSLTDTVGQGGRVVYAYDASGQRVAQARVADANGVGTATGYVASGQVDDANTAATSTGDVSATRYYTFAGSTVAIRTNDNKLALMLGDEQGSTNVMMPVTVQASGALAPATLADAAAITRTSYTPYGELRGADNLATDRGWLGQVEDRVDGTKGTGLTYLNARYYDPTTMRFISPDPLMNPGDPKTLDPYRYADNNPVVFTDATGLAACSGLSGDSEKKCMDAFYRGTGYKKPEAGSHTVILPSRVVAGMCVAPPKTVTFGSPLAPPVGLGTASSQAFLGLAGETPPYTAWTPPDPKIFNPSPGSADPARWGTPRPWNQSVINNKWLLRTAKAAPGLDYVAAGLEWDSNYNSRYANVEDQGDRAKYATERTVVTAGAGIGTAALLTAVGAFLLCPETGVTCLAGVAIVAGVGSVGAEQVAGDAYDQNLENGGTTVMPRNCNSFPTICIPILPSGDDGLA